jgi:hypothetical protein
MIEILDRYFPVGAGAQSAALEELRILFPPQTGDASLYEYHIGSGFLALREWAERTGRHLTFGDIPIPSNEEEHESDGQRESEEELVRDGKGESELYDL